MPECWTLLFKTQSTVSLTLTSHSKPRPRSGPEAEERACEEAAIQEQATGPEEGTASQAAYAGAPIDAGNPSPEVSSSNWQEPPLAEPQDDEFSPFAATGDVE